MPGRVLFAYTFPNDSPGQGSAAMNKKDLNERDICSKLITPAILKAGWDLATQIREEVRSGGNPAPIEEDNSRTMRPPTVGSTVGHRRGSTILSTDGGQS